MKKLILALCLVTGCAAVPHEVGLRRFEEGRLSACHRSNRGRISEQLQCVRASRERCKDMGLEPGCADMALIH